MEDGRITDSQITASGEVDTLPKYHGVTNARLNRLPEGDTTGSWSAKTNDINQWIQADLRVLTRVTGVMIQGRADNDQRVTKFKVQYSDDGVIWKYVRTADFQSEQVKIIHASMSLYNHKPPVATLKSRC